MQIYHKKEFIEQNRFVESTEYFIDLTIFFLLNLINA